MVKTIQRDLIKVNKVLHPKSRKAQKLHQKANKLVTREKAKKFHSMKENLVGEKLKWFQEHLVPNQKVYTSKLCLDIIAKYLGRFDKELEQISIVHSIGKRQNYKRRFASREDIINMTVLHEKEEFETCGLEMPNLLNVQQLEYLRTWNGELRYLQNFHLKRYTRRYLENYKDRVILEEHGSQNDQTEEEEEEEDDSDENSNDAVIADKPGSQNEQTLDIDEGGDSEWSEMSDDEVDEGEDKRKEAGTSSKKKRFHPQKRKNKKPKGGNLVMDIDD